jgi:thimet oligopeptidase
MNKMVIISGMTVLAGITLFGVSRCDKKTMIEEGKMLAHIRTIDDLKELFSVRAQDIPVLTQRYIDQAKEQIQAIIALPDEQRTFANTMLAFDRMGIISNIDLFGAVCGVLKEVSPNEVIRNATREAIMQLSNFSVDWISGNVALYKALKAYAQGNGKTEILRDDERYFLDETMKEFKRAGLDLPEEQLEKVKQLKKELIDLSLAFSSNIANEKRTLECTRADLAGMPDDFINALKRTEHGTFIVGTDYPTYFPIIENCVVETTRKRIFEAFWNRAYPANEKVLESIIAKRDELAHVLGFKSYAHLNLDNQMVKTPERAQQFIKDMLVKLNKKEQAEFDLLTKNLPASVTLTADGKFKPWDIMFVQNMYKKNNLSVDDEKVAEYFQLEPTLSAMFTLYENFFGVKFQEIESRGFWHPEVKLVKVLDAQTGMLLAYLLLDLYPRDNKFNHAAHFGVLPGFIDDNQDWPAVSFVVANFSKSTATKPSLLKAKEVSTLFHEFGHAMHHILAKTRLASFAGTATRHDFVEAPSQMLEEWLWDAQVLKQISKHYKTGESLSDEFINKIIALQQFDRGYFWQRQSFLSSIALAYFSDGANKDLSATWCDVYAKIMHHVVFDPAIHQYASFGHLEGYGARYYGYMWADVLALDIFDHIKEQGLLRPGAGKDYVEFVLSKGGSREPEDMMKEFLGRAPNNKAFLKHMGLN